MDNSTIRPGDIISAMGRTYTVGTVLYQAYYGTRAAARGTSWWGYDVEFKDTDGAYHHWKQNEDGGEVLKASAKRNYADLLPHNVIRCPETFCIDVRPLAGKYTPQVTDAWGKVWYIRIAGRDRYVWTRQSIFARTWTKETATKHAIIVAEYAHEYLMEEDAKH